MEKFKLKQEWYGAKVSIFPPFSNGYEFTLTADTDQKVLRTLYNIEHPAVELVTEKKN